MSESKWEDQDIKQLLKNMPKIKSRQSAESIYKRIENPSGKKSKKHWVPIAASLAALLLLVILIPSFLMMDNTMEMSTSEDSSDMRTQSESNAELTSGSQDSPGQNNEESSSTIADADEAQEEASMEPSTEEYSNDNSTEDIELDSASIAEEAIIDPGTSVYPSEIGDSAYLSIAFVTEDAYVVPMTFIIPANESASGTTNIDLYNQWAGTIDRFHRTEQNKIPHLTICKGNTLY